MVNDVLKTRLGNLITDTSQSAGHRFMRSFFHPQRQGIVGVSTLISDLNTFWRLELGYLDYDTIEARSALIDSDNFDQWLSLFNDFVLPVVVGVWDSAKKDSAHG